MTEDPGAGTIAFLQRSLQANNSTDSTEEAASYNDGSVLRDTFTVYGSILLVIFIAFCWLRRKYPRAYNVRNWVEDIKTPLAKDQFGFFSWIWEISTITEDEIMDECGLDALCFVRILSMGYRISLMGVFNAIWLMPVYATADVSDDTRGIVDRIVEVSIAHVPASSPRLVATALAAWIVFGYTMYLILQEFEWFIDKRHKFLAKPRPQNYTVYVRNIPIEYRTDSGLEDFFRQCFQYESVLEANVRLRTPNLAKLVAQRSVLIANLEHAIAIEDITGEAPQRSASLKSSLMIMGGEKVNAIEAFAEELKALNADIKARIEELETKKSSQLFMQDVEQQSLATLGPSVAGRGDSMYGAGDNVNAEECASLTPSALAVAPRPNGYGTEISNVETAIYNDVIVEEEDDDGDLSTLASRQNVTNHSSSSKSILDAKKSIKQSVHLFKKAANAVKDSAVAVGENAAHMLQTNADGESYEAGFLTFTNLRTAQAALQMLHHSKPFSIEVQEAPDPQDVFWFNVGRTHKELQMGNLLSLAATTALCLLWTIPMSFIASLSTIDALRSEFDFIDSLLDDAPFLVPVFEIGAPLLVVVVNALLPVILQVFSMMEGPVSGAVVEASLFSKLAAFMIIQTFFVSAISGGLMQQLSEMINDYTLIIDLLATSLPAQATYFIQIIFVTTVFSCGMEILRVIPVIKAALRKCIGPRLTKRERQKAFMGLQPLGDPLDFEFADFSSNMVLYFVVLLVYSVISPITNFVVAFCFVYMGSIFRHQFIYIYPARSDSGGKMWINFIRVLVSCMFIGEVTIMGLLGLKKAASAVPLMVPLIVTTILFSTYINQQHFRVTENLPSRECIKHDLRNGPLFNMNLLKNAYLQPEMQVKEAFPEVSTDRELSLGLHTEDEGQYLTPEPSENGK
jgi:hypothetical protein